MPELENLIVEDGRERWVLYSTDQAYMACSAVEPDENGIRHVTPQMVENWQGWNWRDAAARAEKLVSDLEVPWPQLEVAAAEVEAGNLMELSKKLALTAHYIVRVNDLLTPLLARQHTAKEMLEHAVARGMANVEINPAPDAPKKLPARELRAAAYISRDKRLRNMKIEIIEGGAAIKVLEQTRDSLDLLWRTTSRLISARSAEPLDRDT